MAQVRTVVRMILACALALSSLAVSVAPVSANGIGDVYVGAPAHVLEIQVSTKRVVNRVPVSPPATSLAFSNTGRSLYVANGSRQLVTIDIASISVSGSVDLPAPAAAVAAPLGSTLVAALPDLDRVALVDPATASVTLGAVLPGPVDLLAADRRDQRTLAAAKGQSWVAIVDPTSGHATVGHVTGDIVGLTVDRSGGIGYVVTRAPARIVALDLATGRQHWARSLSDDPVGVASTRSGVVVASAHRIWRVSSTSTHAWQTTTGTFLALTASDDGQVVLALEASTLDAWTSDGTRSARVPLSPDAPAVTLAAIPRPSSLLTPTTADSNSPAPHTGPLPATDVLERAITGVPGSPPFGELVAAVALAILAATALAVWSGRTEGRR